MCAMRLFSRLSRYFHEKWFSYKSITIKERKSDLDMSFYILMTFVVAFYVVIWFFDSFFKSCMHYPYFAFLEGTGLRVGIFNFSWTTTAFNRLIYRWSKNLTRALKKWFTCGFIVTIWLFLPFALWTLLMLIVTYFHEKTAMEHAPEVKAMLPGVNVPISDFWVYFLSLALSSMFHELGHAMAAAQEDVQLIAVGLHVFMIMPIAFVQLNPEHLNSLAIGKRLRIYCAGVWHNLVLSLLAVTLLFSTPILFSVAYKTDLGVRVVKVMEDSPLHDVVAYKTDLGVRVVKVMEDSLLDDVRGFAQGDVVITINGCEVKNTQDWIHCLQMAHERFGICTTAEYVSQNDEIMMETVKENNVVECCRKDDLYSFCFEYMEPKVVLDSVLPGQFSCLKPRDMVKDKYEKCTEAGGYACSRGMHCLKPSLNNSTYLIIIERKDKNSVLYLGLPYDLYKSVTVDKYFPRSSMLSFFSPMQLEKLLQYVFIMSMGIGFLNVIPCYGTDGHHITRNLIQKLAIYMNKGSEFVTFFTLLAVIVGTVVTVLMLMHLFYKAFYVDNY